MITTLFIVLVLLFLGLSAFFSASETAITAASKAKLHHLAKEGDKNAAIIKQLRRNLGLVIGTFLICNTLFNTWAISIASGVLIDFFGSEGVLYASVLMSGMIIVFAEVSPKILAVYYPERMLMATAPVIKVIYNIFKPFTLSINYVAKATFRAMGFSAVKTNEDESHASVEELRGVIDMHQGPGEEIASERAMLKSILDLRQVRLDEIMVHRKNVTMIDADVQPSKIVDQVLSSPFTRIPLYDKDPDNVIGILNAKSLLRAVRSHGNDLDKLDIRKLATAPWFVPESTDLLDQLEAFRDRREHFSLVVDEYGSLMGIVTLEDILEEIVGEISDEYDIAVRGVRPQTDGSFIIDGNVTLRDLNRQFDWDLPDENASTLAGLVLYEMRLIPNVGQIFSLNNFRIEILRRQRNQITLLKLTPPKSDAEING